MLNGYPRGRVFLPLTVILFSLGVAFWFAARNYIQRYGMPWHSVLGVYCCFLSLLVLVIAPGLDGMRDLIAERFSNVWSCIILLGFPYLVYAAGTFDLRWSALLRVVAIASAVPLTYRLFPVKDVSRLGWQDLGVAIFLVASLRSHQLPGIWNVPVNLDFMGRLFLIAVSTWSWIFIRKLPGLGYDLKLTPRVLSAAGVNFGLFASIAIPASLAIGFTHWNPRHTRLVSFGVSYLEIFLFIALLEELFFRGFLQTLLSNSLRSGLKAQLLVSGLFGLFHILHAPFPNWKYVLLASVAGWFYGTAFVKGGSIMASALAHALVDSVWRAFF